MSVNKIPYHIRRKLDQKQIDLVEGEEFTLRCRNCSRAWTPDTRNRQRLPKGYWKCPEGCNEAVGEMETRRMRVLLVDDDIPLTKSLAAVMRKSGYKVSTAFTGTQALEASKEHPFEAVILDIRLPDIDGVELLRHIRSEDPVIGTIMLSGAATMEDAVESLNQGADAFILKPADPEELLYRLGTVTGFKRLERELRQARARYTELFTIIHED
ncbi:MAG: response regulator [Candidatus Bathyarchaeota archaeon]|nr:MAG: response regulator [Candidatus Bathyarchaeota archaeon]